MKIDIRKIPHEGDYDAFEALVWQDDELQFTLIKKLSRTELQESIKKECVKGHVTAIQKLKEFTLAEANTIFKNKQYKIGERYVGDFSPCW